MYLQDACVEACMWDLIHVYVESGIVFNTFTLWERNQKLALDTDSLLLAVIPVLCQMKRHTWRIVSQWKPNIFMQNQVTEI